MIVCIIYKDDTDAHATTAPQARPPPRPAPLPRQPPPRLPAPSPHFPFPGLLPLRPRPGASPVGPPRQLPRRQDPSDQPAPPPMAPGAAVASQLPSSEEDPGGDLPTQSAPVALGKRAAPGPAPATVIKARHHPPPFTEAFLTECSRDRWPDWRRQADQILEDEQLVALTYEALAQRHPHSRTRGRPGTPAEVVLRMLVLKHLRNWSFQTLEWEVKTNLVYRQFTRVGAG